MIRFQAISGSATALRFVADPRYLSNNHDKENRATAIKFCNPCLPTFLLPISPAGQTHARRMSGMALNGE
jgi:hypothetical protein